MDNILIALQLIIRLTENISAVSSLISRAEAEGRDLTDEEVKGITDKATADQTDFDADIAAS